MQADIPMKVNIVLVGLDGTGAFAESQDEEALEGLLSHTLRSVCPVFAATGEQSRACFSAVVAVTHALGAVYQIENTMASLMVRS